MNNRDGLFFLLIIPLKCHIIRCIESIRIIWEGVSPVNTYNNISSELKSYFGSNSIFRILLPIDIVFLFGGLFILALDNFSVGIGGFVYYFAYWAFILGIILTFANMRNQLLYIGLWGYSAINVIGFFISLLGKYHILSWHDLFNIAIFGGLGYLVFKRTVSGSSSSSGQNM